MKQLNTIFLACIAFSSLSAIFDKREHWLDEKNDPKKYEFSSAAFSKLPTYDREHIRVYESRDDRCFIYYRGEGGETTLFSCVKK